MKWLTSGSHRLKANLNRSFGARKTKKAAAVAAGKKDVSYKSIVSSNKAAKSSRLRIARSKAITRTEPLDDKPAMLPSEIYHDSKCPPTAVATTMKPLQLRNHIKHALPDSDRVPLIARRKEESNRPYFIRNRTPASNVIQNHAVDQHRLQHDFLFGADSIERIVELQEQPQKNGMVCDDTQTVGEILPREHFTGRSADEHHQYRRELISESGPRTNQEHFTPITDNTHFQYQPPQQRLRFFNNGVEVDIGGMPLSARLESH